MSSVLSLYIYLYVHDGWEVQGAESIKLRDSGEPLRDDFICLQQHCISYMEHGGVHRVWMAQESIVLLMADSTSVHIIPVSDQVGGTGTFIHSAINQAHDLVTALVLELIICVEDKIS